MGSGKSSLAKQLAQKLRALYVDTGALYRALGLALQERNVPLIDGPPLEKALKDIKLRYGVSKTCLIEVDGRDLSQEIRRHAISKLSSQVAALPAVRRYLLGIQRRLPHQERLCVMEGRDIGSVVFPRAFCKIFLTASSEVRARRRLEQLSFRERERGKLDLEQMKKDVEKRDEADRTRALAPLVQVSDAVLLDSSDLTSDQVLARMEEIVVHAQAKENENENE